MDKLLLQQKLTEYVKLWNDTYNGTDSILEAMVVLMKPYLAENPSDEEIWLKLALAEYTAPIADYAATIDSLNKIMLLNPHNIPALLMLTYAEAHYSGITIRTLKKLVSAIPNNSKEEALLLYAQALYYLGYHANVARYDKIKAEHLFYQSVNTYSGFVYPHEELGKLYMERGLISEAYYHFSQAIKNTTSVYQHGDFLNILSIDCFIAERVKGTHSSGSSIEILQKLIAECLTMRPSIIA